MELRSAILFSGEKAASAANDPCTDPFLLYKITEAVHRLPLVLLFMVLVGAPLVGVAPAPADPLAWLNGVRRGAGAGPVQEDPLLSRAAALWAERCAASGLISHRGGDGSTALDRYRSLGGTEARVGEIIGAGPDVTRVEKGWMASDEHRRLALSPDWTHAGWGSAASGSSRVTVMMFTRKMVERLVIAPGPDVMTVTGAFGPEAAARGVLYNGLEQVAPVQWEPVDRTFRFEVPSGLIAGYIRLGFVTRDGRFVLTNAFTWPPGTGSPGASGRFAPPAPSP
jgi:hypothetical protein